MAEKQAVEEFDFDSWDDKAEEAALTAIGVESRIKHIIVGHDFIGRFPDGDIVRVPLRLSVEDVDAAAQSASSGSPIDQLRELLVRIGDEEKAKLLMSKSIASMSSFADKYFRLFERINEVTLGE